MSQSAEKIKRIVSFKQKLEKKVEELESELEDLRATLEAVNSVLLEKGFKHAEIGKPPSEMEVLKPKGEMSTELSPSQPSIEHESVIPLRTVSGELLATLYLSEDLMRIVPVEDKNFDINTPPFTPFLVERVLAKMQEKDSELARTEQISHEKIFSYSIVREGDIIHEITIKHFDQDRLRELKSSIRWTFEKMHEKMKSQP